jgi:hypothetical protein
MVFTAGRVVLGETSTTHIDITQAEVVGWASILCATLLVDPGTELRVLS